MHEQEKYHQAYHDTMHMKLQSNLYGCSTIYYVVWSFMHFNLVTILEIYYYITYPRTSLTKPEMTKKYIITTLV